MNTLTVLARLAALHHGAPEPLSDRLPFPRACAADRMVFASVRMAGESGPWAFAVGRPDRDPLVLTVPEPRDRDEVAAMCAQLAETLAGHVGHPGLDARATPEQRARRQLWVPGASHLEMLHLLEYRYHWARRGEAARVELLLALSRAAGFVFRESQRPGQVRVYEATARLRELFAFPAEDIRQAHLGFLLAWLETSGDLGARRRAARAAERQAVGITLDPRIERDELEGAVARWRETKSAGARSAITSVLERELRYRFALTARAIAIVESDPRRENDGVSDLLELGAREIEGQYLRIERQYIAAGEDVDERPFVPHPETDHHPSAAAARYFAAEASAEAAATALVHHDQALLRASVVSGDAIDGVVVDVVDEGTGRARVPVWTVESSATLPLRLREGSKVALVGAPSRDGVVRAITIGPTARHIEIEIRGAKTTRALPHLPDPVDADAMLGAEVAFVAASMHDLTFKKSMGSWDSDVPGAWLTHAAPQPAPTASASCQPDVLALVQSLEGP
jgi:hypothetical protein